MIRTYRTAFPSSEAIGRGPTIEGVHPGDTGQVTGRAASKVGLSRDVPELNASSARPGFRLQAPRQVHAGRGLSKFAVRGMMLRPSGEVCLAAGEMGDHGRGGVGPLGGRHCRRCCCRSSAQERSHELLPHTKRVGTASTAVSAARNRKRKIRRMASAESGCTALASGWHLSVPWRRSSSDSAVGRMRSCLALRPTARVFSLRCPSVWDAA